MSRVTTKTTTTPVNYTNKILKEQLTDSSIKDNQLANVFGTHLLKKLAVSVDMKIDSGYSDNSEDMQCPCGCKTFIKVGDNSMGHEEVWHGSVDILVGPVAVTVTKSSIDEENSELEEEDSAFDLEICKLEELRHQLIPESIIFSFAMRCGLVPIVGLSQEYFKIFMYEPNEIYEHHIKIGGLKNVESDVSEYKAGGNCGKFKRIEELLA